MIDDTYEIFYWQDDEKSNDGEKIKCDEENKETTVEKKITEGVNKEEDEPKKKSAEATIATAAASALAAAAVKAKVRGCHNDSNTVINNGSFYDKLSLYNHYLR